MPNVLGFSPNKTQFLLFHALNTIGGILLGRSMCSLTLDCASVKNLGSKIWDSVFNFPLTKLEV